jgi:hypothetical protein
MRSTNKLPQWLRRLAAVGFTEKAVLLATTLTSFLGTWYYYTNGQLNLAMGDAVSRLDIARKVIDNLHPGFAQLGNIWLPLPQVLMLPFIWSTWMWHSGMAGAIMSGVAFTAGVYFLFRIGRDIFESRLSGVLMVVMALANPNLIYMQSTAMSETLLISLVIMAMYYLLRWAKLGRSADLIPAALLVSLATLTRFEAYFFAAGAVLFVATLALMRHRRWRQAEGQTILFGTVALTGIAAWALYLGVLFGDPLYWMHIYAHQVSIVSNDAITAVPLATTEHGPHYHHLIASITTYADSTGFMNGLLLSGLAVAALAILAIYLIRRRQQRYLLLLALPLAVFVFTVYTIFNGGIDIDQPGVSWQNLWNPQLSSLHEYNIRYGLMTFPAIALLLGWLGSRRKLLAGVIATAVAVQFTLLPGLTPALTYRLPVQMAQARTGLNADDLAAAGYLKSHYHGGLIMISALAHDPVMFYLGYNYNTYIHEGAGDIWNQARRDPSTQAEYVFMNTTVSYEQTSDTVTKYLHDSDILSTRYNKIYENDTLVIYERKH